MQNTEEEGEMYFPFVSAPILYATPRHAAGHGKGRGLKMGFLCFNALALLGVSLYLLLRKYWGSGGNSAFVMRVLPCKENKYFILSDKKHRKC